MKWNGAVVLAAGFIAMATLLPTGAGGGGSALCILCGERGLSDFILNVALFAPLGVALAGRRVPFRWALLAGGLFSASIEVAQITAVAGRDANAGDLVANTVGTGLGWALLHGLAVHHATAHSRRFAATVAAAGTLVALLLVGLWLLAPSFPDTKYFLQWTADLGSMQVYEGELLTSRVGPMTLPGPPGPIERSDSVRALLREGAGPGVRVRLGPPPTSTAPILSIYDDRQQEIILLGAARNDVVYRYRRRGQILRLDRGEIRFPGALAGFRQGEVVDLSVTRDGPDYCAHVDERTYCTSWPSVSDTWTLLMFRPFWGMGFRRAVGLAWLAALFVPAGLLGRGWRDRALGAAVGLAGVLVGPWALGFATTTFPELAAVILGVVAGGITVDTLGAPASLPGSTERVSG